MRSYLSICPDRNTPLAALLGHEGTFPHTWWDIGSTEISTFLSMDPADTVPCDSEMGSIFSMFRGRGRTNAC